MVRKKASLISKYMIVPRMSHLTFWFVVEEQYPRFLNVILHLNTKCDRGGTPVEIREQGLSATLFVLRDTERMQNYNSRWNKCLNFTVQKVAIVTSPLEQRNKIALVCTSE